jgi:sulfur-oxidizing protein SoxY
MNLRRGLLWALGWWGCGVATRAWAQHVPDDALLHPHVGNSRLHTGRVKLELPRLADNGFTVPLKVSVTSPMTPQDHVRRLLLLSNRNPRPLIAEFEFGPASAPPVMATRVRLGGSQTVFALAQLSDGSWWMDRADVEVTESACLDQT